MLSALSVFCRHNRFTAECPICSKGTVLDPSPAPSRPRTARGKARKRVPQPPPGFAAGPHSTAGPYGSGGGSYEVRLDRVPGGLRLASWRAGQILREAPVLDAGDLPGLLAQAAERGVLEDDRDRLLAALGGAGERVGASPGRAGELRDELRVEALGDGRLRIARWVMRPHHGWELQEAPVMLPAGRYAEALERAAVPSG